jgi:hypothetical protein
VDKAYYLSTNPDVAEAGLDPVVHYAHTGWREGRDPNPWFHTRSYLAANLDVAAAGVNPLAHYVEIGFVDGRLEAEPAVGEKLPVSSNADIAERPASYSPSNCIINRFISDMRMRRFALLEHMQ